MSISQRIEKDIVTAMKARDEHRLTTLRMVKSALKNREIDKREALSEAEEQQLLTTLLKQRRESIESFTKGGRPELAEKEKAEIAMIEAYMPRAAGEEEIRHVIEKALEYMTEGSGGVRPGPKDLGPAMRVVQQWILSNGLRADGRTVSELLREALAQQPPA